MGENILETSVERFRQKKVTMLIWLKELDGKDDEKKVYEIFQVRVDEVILEWNLCTIRWKVGIMSNKRENAKCAPKVLN